MRTLFLAIFLILGCTGCSNNASQENKQRLGNLKGEFIFRRDNETLFATPPSRKITKEPYPWEEKYAGNFPRITKEFFRCKGDSSHPIKVMQREGKEPIRYFDCVGSQGHSLPLENGKELIYPCLLELLNYLQEKTDKAVIITSGHRCPQHNLYCDASKANWASKHMIGAEVDFYIAGMEESPQQIVALIIDFYKQHPLYKGKAQYEQFARYDKELTTLSTPPWFNKEIFLKLYKKTEGRNSDNSHPFAYLSMQVRYDRDLNIPVVYDAKKAQHYERY